MQCFHEQNGGGGKIISLRSFEKALGSADPAKRISLKNEHLLVVSFEVRSGIMTHDP